MIERLPTGGDDQGNQRGGRLNPGTKWHADHDGTVRIRIRPKARPAAALAA